MIINLSNFRMRFLEVLLVPA